MQRSTSGASPVDDQLTRDDFLDGRVQAWQPRRGFRSGTDAVLLAAAVPAAAGDTVLELGCGVGVAALCLAHRVPGARVTGVEVQPDYAALARRNGVTCVTADLANLPPDLRQLQFAHVMMNPPFFEAARGRPAADPGRATALAGDTPLEVWITTGLRRLAPGGSLTILQHIARLPECMDGIRGRLGHVVLRPIAARAGHPPERFLLQGRLGTRGAFRMTAPLVMHDGPLHAADGDDFTPVARAILRGGAPLND